MTGLTDTAALGGTYQLALKADQATHAKTLTSTVTLAKGFPVKTVDFGKNKGSYHYDADTGELTLSLTDIQQSDLVNITVAVPPSTTADQALTYSVTAGSLTTTDAAENTGTFSTA